MASHSDAALSVEFSRFLTNKNTHLEDRLALKAFLDTRPKHSNLSAKFSRFLTHETTNPEDLLALEAFFDARPKYSKPIHFISDVEQRLELLREIQQEYKKHNFRLNSTAALWSALMVAPLERLRYLRDISLNEFPRLPGSLIAVTSYIPMLLKTFLAKQPSESEFIRADVSKKRKSSSSVHSEAIDEPNQGRSQIESDKCKQRDRCCIVTGTANPDICHVFPFAAKKTPDRTSSGLEVFFFIWGEQTFQRLNDILVRDGKIIDTASNMVALEPLLHKWWSKAMIGFEPIEKIENGIRLRFRWLPKTTLMMNDKVTLDLNPFECLQPYSNQDGNVEIAHSSTYRPILDGTIIDITTQDESAVPNWDIFSLQWDLIRMASLCGAAEASDDDDWELDDDEDEAPPAKVARTTDDLPISPVTSGFQPPQSLPLRSVLVQSRESSPTKVLQPRDSSQFSQSRESSPAKSPARRVDENNP